MKTLSSLLLVATLATGCNSGLSPAKPVSKADVAATEITLTQAVRLANDCLNAAIGPCQDPNVRAPMIADIHKAHDAFRRLQVASASDAPAYMAMVNEALRQLTVATPVNSAAGVK